MHRQRRRRIGTWLLLAGLLGFVIGAGLVFLEWAGSVPVGAVALVLVLVGAWLRKPQR